MLRRDETRTTSRLRGPRTTFGNLQGAAMVTILIGLWLAASALIFHMNNEGYWHHLFWGTITALAGGLQLYQESRAAPPVLPVSIALIAIGAWIVLTPFIYGSMIAPLVSSLVAGIALIIVASYELRHGKQVAARRLV